MLATTTAKAETHSEIRRQKHRTVALVITSYFIVSILMVFLNKALMTKPGASIPAPLFVVWYQCLVTVAICWGMGYLGQLGFYHFRNATVMRYDPVVALKVMPLSVIFVAMIGFNQLCLRYVEVSFYNVARSLTIVFNVALTYFLLKETTSRNAILTLVVVVIGFVVGTDGEVNFSLVGTLFGVASSLCVALNSVVTSTVLKHVDNDKNLLIFYNNVNSLFLFLPLIYFTEASTIKNHVELLFSPFFWTAMTVAGVLGYLIGVVTVWQIQVTSPLTHNISGTAKAGLQTGLAYLIWKNKATVKAVLGVLLTLVGSLLYAYVRLMEAEAKSKETAQATAVQLSTVTSHSSSSADGQEDDSDSDISGIALAPLDTVDDDNTTEHETIHVTVQHSDSVNLDLDEFEEDFDQRS